MSARERSQAGATSEQGWGSPPLDPVVAHRLLNAVTVIQTNSATLARWGHLINEVGVRELADRIYDNAVLVSEGLREAIHGVPASEGTATCAGDAVHDSGAGKPDRA